MRTSISSYCDLWRFWGFCTERVKATGIMRELKGADTFRGSCKICPLKALVYFPYIEATEIKNKCGCVAICSFFFLKNFVKLSDLTLHIPAVTIDCVISEHHDSLWKKLWKIITFWLFSSLLPTFLPSFSAFCWFFLLLFTVFVTLFPLWC